MSDLWQMTVADRRWWINQTIDFLQQQKDAQEKSLKNNGKRPNSIQSQNPDQINAARQMLQQYHGISNSEG